MSILPCITRAGAIRHLLSHTSGITGLENEEIMKYYARIGHARVTIIARYFMSNDKEVRKGALPHVLEVMGSLVLLLHKFGLQPTFQLDQSPKLHLLNCFNDLRICIQGIYVAFIRMFLAIKIGSGGITFNLSQTTCLEMVVISTLSIVIEKSSVISSIRNNVLTKELLPLPLQPQTLVF